MNDIRQKGFPIKLDKTRHLKFDLNALIELEDRYDTIEKALNAISGNPKIKDIRYILYVALIHEDEELTEKQAGKLVNLHNLEEVVEALGNAVTGVLPEVSEEEKN